jgi:HlyD family secretion protein
MRGKWLLTSGTVILVAMAVGALSLLRRESVSPPPAPSSPPEPPAAFAGSEISLGGRIQAQHVIPVPVPIQGTIDRFFAEVGEEVYEGQLLAEISNTELEEEHSVVASEMESARSRVNHLESSLIAARLGASRARADATRARAEFEHSEKTFSRQQLLYREGATPRLNYEKSRKEFDLAKARFVSLDEVARHAEDQVAAQRKNLDSARQVLAEKTQELEEVGGHTAAGQVLSPADGLIVSRFGEPGQVVRGEEPEFFLIAVDLWLLEVVVEPEPPVLEQIRPGQEAIIQVAEIPGQGIPGKVTEVRNNQVIVEFSNPSPAVGPGLTAQVRIKLT